MLDSPVSCKLFKYYLVLLVIALPNFLQYGAITVGTVVGRLEEMIGVTRLKFRGLEVELDGKTMDGLVVR